MSDAKKAALGKAQQAAKTRQASATSAVSIPPSVNVMGLQVPTLALLAIAAAVVLVGVALVVRSAVKR